jgi:hypothetical protein
LTKDYLPKSNATGTGLVDSAIYSNSTGNIGIGTTAPSNKLDVSGGDIKTTGNLISDAGTGNSNASLLLTGRNSGTANIVNISSNWTGGLTINPAQSATLIVGGLALGSYSINNAPTNGLVVSGNVGIGTAVPRGALEVDGSVYLIGGNVGIGTSNPTNLLTVEKDNLLRGSSYLTMPGIQLTNTTLATAGVPSQNPPTLLFSGSNWDSGAVHAKQFMLQADVGGADNPDQYFSLFSIRDTTQTMVFQIDGGGSFYTAGVLNANNQNYFGSVATGEAKIIPATGSAFRLDLGGTTSAFPALALNGSDLQVIRADGSTSANLLVTGNVGIGTSLPVVGLSVGAGAPSWTAAMVNQNDEFVAGDVEIDGALYVDGFLYGNGSKLTGISTISGLDAGNVPKANATGTGLIDSAIYDVNGLIGIGTTSPASKLDVAGTLHASGLVTADNGIYVNGTVTLSAVGTSLYIGSAGVGSPRFRNEYDATNRFLVINSGSGGAGDNTLYLNTDVSSSVVAVSGGGNVGVAAVTPTARFQVLSKPADSGAYSFSNWNGTGNAVSAAI